jgi:GxxExxY protein
MAEQIVPIHYKSLVFDGSYRLDLLVQNEIVVEVKAVETTLPVHRAQLLSYLRLTNKQLGLLVNFNVPVLVDGVKRIMNGFPSASLAATRPTREEERDLNSKPPD